VTFLIQSPFFLGDYIYNFIKFWSLYISHSIINIHNYKNIQYYKKKISSYYLFLIHLLWNEWAFVIFTLNGKCQIISWNQDFCLCLSSHLHLWSLHMSSILHLWSLHLCLCFIHGSLHYTENIKGIRTW